MLQPAQRFSAGNEQSKHNLKTVLGFETAPVDSFLVAGIILAEAGWESADSKIQSIVLRVLWRR